MEKVIEKLPTTPNPVELNNNFIEMTKFMKSGFEALGSKLGNSSTEVTSNTPTDSQDKAKYSEVAAKPIKERVTFPVRRDRSRSMSPNRESRRPPYLRSVSRPRNSGERGPIQRPASRPRNSVPRYRSMSRPRNGGRFNQPKYTREDFGGHRDRRPSPHRRPQNPCIFCGRRDCPSSTDCGLSIPWSERTVRFGEMNICKTLTCLKIHTGICEKYERNKVQCSYCGRTHHIVFCSELGHLQEQARKKVPADPTDVDKPSTSGRQSASNATQKEIDAALARAKSKM